MNVCIDCHKKMRIMPLGSLKCGCKELDELVYRTKYIEPIRTKKEINFMNQIEIASNEMNIARENYDKIKKKINRLFKK